MRTTSIMIKFRPSSIINKEGSLYFQLIKNRKIAVVTTDYHVFEEEWDPELSQVCLRNTSPRRKQYLQHISFSLWRDYEDLRFNVLQREHEENFDLKDIAEYYRKKKTPCYLSEYIEELIPRLDSEGKKRSIIGYRNLLISYYRFSQNKDLALNDLNPELIKNFETFMLKRGNNLNTSAYYLGMLRTIYNKAVKDKRIEYKGESLFENVFIGLIKTEKSIDINLIDKLLNLSNSLENAIKNMEIQA